MEQEISQTHRCPRERARRRKPAHPSWGRFLFCTYFKAAWRRCAPPRRRSSRRTLFVYNLGRRSRNFQMWGCWWSFSSFEITSSVLLRSICEEKVPRVPPSVSFTTEEAVRLGWLPEPQQTETQTWRTNHRFEQTRFEDHPFGLGF